MASINRDPRERLIVALDVPTRDDARRIVDELDGLVSFFKVGYQLFLAEGMPFVADLVASGKHVFLDLKLDDVEETIALAVEQVAASGAEFLTIHGGRATARAALRGRASAAKPRILFVTLLTSLDRTDLEDLGILGPGKRFPVLEDYVRWRAQQALEAKCEGLIAAGSSIADLRKTFGDEPVIVTPGVRPAGFSSNEHKRPTTPRDAMLAGADYLVVGRPIRDAGDRRATARAIIDEIEEGMAARV
jgi:orotidine-5'-phosphate decarboxylase